MNDLDEIGGMCTFSEARQLYYAADAGARLPEEHADTSRLHSRTEAYAASAIAAYANMTQSEISFGDEAGAIARIRSNDLDGAFEALEQERTPQGVWRSRVHETPQFWAEKLGADRRDH